MTDLQEEATAAARLVRRIRAGDAAAEADLFERYADGLRFLLRRWCGDEAQAEDLGQETFRVVIERLRREELAEPERLAGFVQGIARNLLRNARRKSLRRRTEADSEHVDAAVDTRPQTDPMRDALRAEEARLVRRAVGRMRNERDRQLLYRYYLAEEDKAAICHDLGLDDVHFNRVLYRARQRFKAEWRTDRPDDAP